MLVPFTVSCSCFPGKLQLLSCVHSLVPTLLSSRSAFLFTWSWVNSLPWQNPPLGPLAPPSHLISHKPAVTHMEVVAAPTLESLNFLFLPHKHLPDNHPVHHAPSPGLSAKLAFLERPSLMTHMKTVTILDPSNWPFLCFIFSP